MSSFLFWGSVNGAIAVILGAFGAHGLKSKLTPDLLAVYQTAVQYHFYHALGLMLIGIVLLNVEQPSLRWGGYSMLMGIMLFSGSLYVLSITGIKWLGAITPIGGLCFIVGWSFLAWGAFQISR